MRTLPFILLAGALAGSLRAQDSLPPFEGGLTTSLGQPARHNWHAGGTFGVDWREDEESAIAAYGLFGGTLPIGPRLTNVLALTGEAYGGVRGSLLDGGVRALMQVPVLRLGVGVDYNVREHRVGFLAAATVPVRRGGILGGGSMFRLEYEGGPLRAARATLLVPLGQPRAGRTRPREHTDVAIRRTSSTTMPPPDAVRLDSALGVVRQAARRLDALVVPYLDGKGTDAATALAPMLAALRERPAIPGVVGPGLQVDGVIRVYHAELVRAFSMAATGTWLPPGGSTAEGEAAAARAREILRDHVLYPYDRELGRRRAKHLLRELALYARGNFARETVSRTVLSPEREAALLYVFDHLLVTIEGLERDARKRWGDDRVVWLPLQLALRPEDHDTQDELDGIIEAATASKFTDGNRVWYVVNAQFITETIRSIHAARDYHVLWIHDFRGRNSQQQPDARSLRFVADAYIRALAAGVRQYDERRRLPAYFIILDAFYYYKNDSRLWMTLLEHPLGPVPDLPPGYEEFTHSVREAQAQLREALAQSRLLQAETAQYGQEWLDNLIKVHVNITNPGDLSFASRDLLPLVGIPDDVMRDHRKLILYDADESDPQRGLAIYTGMGIGEHYMRPQWEDRSIMVRGPAALALKAQVRQVLLSQGMRPDQIPFPLRPHAGPPAGTTPPTDGLGQRAMDLHNLTGLQEKRINVARAVLYSLMPPGSVVKVPDSLWGSAVYVSLLTGSSFRGVRVLFVGPSLASAPSSGWPAMGIAHELFARLIVIQQELGIELDEAGGLLKTGIYNPGVHTEEVLARFASAYRNARRTPFLRRLFPTDASLDTLLVHAMELAPPPSDPLRAPATPPKQMPKLHLKAGFFASRDAWDLLIRRPEFTQVLEAYLAQLLREQPDSSDVMVPAAALTEASAALVDAFRRSLSEEQRRTLIYYMMVGSANQDYRSMFMDGEATVLLSGWSGVVSLIDFALLMNLSVWIDDLEMLDALMPPPSG
ncbi:MAG TPA: hypothetical protein VFY20_05935, partial [Gemmatimonadales bacterium]|nr:hypothetical protein [Gemmatimonadales bacterium]